MEALLGSGAKVEVEAGPRAELRLEGEYEEEEEEEEEKETKEEAEDNDAGCKCNICLFQVVCPVIAEHPSEEKLPPKYSLQSLYMPECSCTFHYKCLVDFLRHKFTDSTSVGAEGMECPNGTICQHYKANNKYFYITAKELKDMVAFGGKIKNSLKKFKTTSLALMMSSVNQSKEEYSIIYDNLTLANDLGVAISNIDELSIFVSDSTFTKKESNKLISWIDEKTETYFASKIDTYIKATSKACPECNARHTHFHGHQCHHISPNNGCPNCHTNYCYKCLGTEKQNFELRGARGNCLCGYWSNYCRKLETIIDICDHIEFNSNIPYDKRCGCSICPDCTFDVATQTARPCSFCPGDCAVCMGFLLPGPTTILKVFKKSNIITALGPKFSDEVADEEKNNLHPTATKFMFWEMCRHGELQELTPDLDDFINSQDMEGRSALIMACDAGKVETVRILLRHRNINVNLPDIDGKSALHWAASNGHIECVCLLLDNSADINGIATISTSTPLLCAIKNRHYGCVERIVADSRVNINLTNSDGCSPLHLAAKINDPISLRILLTKPYINIFQKDKNGNTPIVCAMKLKYEACVCVLMCRDELDINTVYGNMNTLLLWSSSNGLFHCARLALGHPDIDITKTDKDGATPLYLASENGHLEIICLIQGHPSYTPKKHKRMKFGSRKYKA